MEDLGINSTFNLSSGVVGTFKVGNQPFHKVLNRTDKLNDWGVPRLTVADHILSQFENLHSRLDTKPGNYGRYGELITNLDEFYNEYFKQVKAEIDDDKENHGFKDQVLQLAGKLNKIINRDIIYEYDYSDEFGKYTNSMATPNTTAIRKSGDCEDQALLKQKLLITMGIKADLLILRTNNDPSEGRNDLTEVEITHAVSIVYDNKGRPMVLDNDVEDSSPEPLDDYLKRTNQKVAGAYTSEGDLFMADDLGAQGHLSGGLSKELRGPAPLATQPMQISNNTYISNNHLSA